MTKGRELSWLRKGIDRRAFNTGLAALPLALAAPLRAAAAERPRDAVPMVRAELERLRAQGGGTLSLPPGEHHFWPDAALAKHLYVSNNDPGENRIVFPLEEFRELVVE